MLNVPVPLPVPGDLAAQGAKLNESNRLASMANASLKSLGPGTGRGTRTGTF